MTGGSSPRGSSAAAAVGAAGPVGETFAPAGAVRRETCSYPAEAAELRETLLRKLLGLNFHAFARCICLLLGSLGYEEVELAGRTYWKGRNRKGGFDIAAAALAAPAAVLPAPSSGRSGLGKRRVIVQVKQFGKESSVYQRSVDELRGVCLRVGASEALLITTSSFSPAIDQRRLLGAPVAPVRLIDGEYLIDLMIQQRLGVQEDGTGRARKLVVDDVFFSDLCRAAREGNDRSGASSVAVSASGGDAARGGTPGIGSREDGDIRPDWQVTVTVSSGVPVFYCPSCCCGEDESLDGDSSKHSRKPNCSQR